MFREPSLLPLFLPEGLDHAKPRQHFLQNREGGALEDFRGFPALPQALAGEPGDSQDDRSERRSDQSQLPVDPRGDVEHPRHHSAAVSKGTPPNTTTHWIAAASE